MPASPPSRKSGGVRDVDSGKPGGLTPDRGFLPEDWKGAPRVPAPERLRQASSLPTDRPCGAGHEGTLHWLGARAGLFCVRAPRRGYRRKQEQECRSTGLWRQMGRPHLMRGKPQVRVHERGLETEPSGHRAKSGLYGSIIHSYHGRVSLPHFERLFSRWSLVVGNRREPRFDPCRTSAPRHAPNL
jgi:hypothetical protein